MQCSQCANENPASAVFCNACGNRLERICTGCGRVNPLGANFCNQCGQKLSTDRNGSAPASPLGPPDEVSTSAERPEPIPTQPLKKEVDREPDVSHLVRFVDRRQELDALQTALNKATRGQGGVVVVGGEPGVGKSRLFREFKRSYVTNDWRVMVGVSVSHGKAPPFKPVIDMLKTYFEIEEGDDETRIRERVGGRMLTLDEALTNAIPPILSLFEVHVEDAAWGELGPPERRRQTLSAVRRLLLKEAQVRPLLLIFEDLHRVDAETQALLDTLIGSLEGARILLLANNRPGYEHDWAEESCYSAFTLAPLPPEGVDEILNGLLGESAVLGPLKELLIQRTKGNPFFLEEILRMLVETGAVSGEEGAYHLEKDLTEVLIPSTVQETLLARMDRLPAGEKRLLQTASTIGTHFTHSLVTAVAGIEKDELNQGLAALKAAEFLYETEGVPEQTFHFKHAITHEVVYGSLLHERRRTLHAVTVDTIERQAGSDIDKHLERLAHHAFLGEVWPKAFQYSQQAGEKARARSANKDAVKYFEQAMTALEHLPKNRESIEQMIDVQMVLFSALVISGNLHQIIENIQKAEALANELGDQRRLSRIYAYMGNYHLRTGDAESAKACGERAQSIAEHLEDVSIHAVVNNFLGRAYQFLGDFPQAIRCYRKNVDSLKGDLQYERFGMASSPDVLTKKFFAWCLAERGEFDEASALGEEATRVAEKMGQSFALSQANHGAGMPLLYKGDFEKAIPMLERCLALCQEADLKVALPETTSSLGYAYVLSKRLADGLPLLEQGLRETSAQGQAAFIPLWLAWLGEGQLMAGLLEDATRNAIRTLGISRERKERGFEAWALRLLGEVYAHPGSLDAEKAEDYYRMAFALTSELGMRPLAAHCHKGLGALYGRTGEDEKARNELTAAVDMYREMGMGFFLRQAEELMA